MKMRLFCTIGFLFLIHLTGVVKAQSTKSQFPLIPYPVSVQLGKGSFKIDKNTLLYFDQKIDAKVFDYFQQQLKVFTGFTMARVDARTSDHNYIEFKIEDSQNRSDTLLKHDEAYVLTCNEEHIEVMAGHEKGLFYGLQSLMQLIQTGGRSADEASVKSAISVKSDVSIKSNVKLKSAITIKSCVIIDYPRFAYRGMHLDVGRHMFPVETLKKWIDLLALYKINNFHWHLTDDQGWRIEIKKYPKLQSVSAYRNETIIGHKRSEPHRFDGKRYGGYYTQEEIKEVVKYAMERHINVIPEIEMPGHAQAVLAAYPELGCTGGPYKTATYWGVFEDVFCAGNEQTFTFLDDVMDEVLNLFPSTYIHVGGDECPKTRWKACPKCQGRIKSEHLKDEHELQSYFIRRMEKYLEGKGRKIIGWDEILEGGLAPSATVMSWRGLEGGIAAARMKHDVIMTPEKYVYLDYYQSYNEKEPIAAGGFTPLSKVYSYEPVPEELNKEEAGYIKGVQANVWSEYLENPQKAEYMMFPRVIALAEIAWTQKPLKDYSGFLKRLRLQDKMLQSFNVNYFKDYDEITGDALLIDRQPKLKMQTTSPDGVIRYTTNGKLPDHTSLIYKSPLIIDKTEEINAAVFNKNIIVGRVYKKDFNITKSTGKKISLTYRPQGNYAPESPSALVNGVSGSPLYNDGEWSGFSAENLEAVIDLEKQESVSSIGLNILKHHWQKMWEPDLLKFEVSGDGEKYTEVYRQTSFDTEGINKIIARIQPVKVRYIRVTAVNKGIIPEGGYGAGGKAWLLADEIFVN